MLTNIKSECNLPEIKVNYNCYVFLLTLLFADK